MKSKKAYGFLMNPLFLGWVIFIALAVLVFAFPSEMAKETPSLEFYQGYKERFVRSDGHIISNYEDIPWCPNPGIGCGNETTSEAISRFAHAALLFEQRSDFDLAFGYYRDHMAHPVTKHMMWKLDEEGNPTTGGGGETSAVDGELIFIGALLDADDKWGGFGFSSEYKDAAVELMRHMRPGIIDARYMPFCMYVTHEDVLTACEQRVFLGYLKLDVLRRMCELDSYYCLVYETSKELMVGAIQDGGIYSTYYVDTKRYTFENAPIHSNWVLKHLILDGGSDTAEVALPFYLESRSVFYANQGQICQEFQPGYGCKQGYSPLWVYSEYLEMATHLGDDEFKEDLINQLKIMMYANGAFSYSPDNFANIVVLESLGVALNEGKYT